MRTAFSQEFGSKLQHQHNWLNCAQWLKKNWKLNEMESLVWERRGGVDIIDYYIYGGGVYNNLYEHFRTYKMPLQLILGIYVLF